MVIVLASASFASPILIKSDAFGTVLGSPAAAADGGEAIAAGGMEFTMPTSWRRLATSSASTDRSSGRGTIVAAICPRGGSAAGCAKDVQVTLIAFSGKPGHELPELGHLQDQLRRDLAKEFTGIRSVEVHGGHIAGGVDALDYDFTHGPMAHGMGQRIAAYRHADGSGVIALITGTEGAEGTAALDTFLEGARTAS